MLVALHTCFNFVKHMHRVTRLFKSLFVGLFSRKKHGQENIRATLGFWKLIWFDLKVKSLFLERVSGIARSK